MAAKLSADTNCPPVASIVSAALIAFAAIAVRAMQSLPFDRILGVNGMYYPVQIRSLIENGALPFPDMPGLFYFIAGIHRASGLGIIVLCKLTGIVAPVLILLPFAFFSLRGEPAEGRIGDGNSIGRRMEHAALWLFVSFSFGPLLTRGDLLKNGAALPFAATVLLLLVRALQSWPDIGNRMKLALALSISIASGLTALLHFGTFAAVCFVCSAVLLLFPFGKPLIRLSALGLIPFAALAVGLFDPRRAHRLLGLTGELFERPLVFNGPPDPIYLLAVLVSIVLAAVGFGLRLKRFWGLPAAYGLLLLPLLDAEYLKRFSLLVFLPQAVYAMLLFEEIGRRGRRKLRNGLCAFLYGTCLLSVVFLFSGPPLPTLSDGQRVDIQAAGRAIEGDRDRVLIIARHGLEWWTAWELGVAVAQPKAVGAETFVEYGEVYSLVEPLPPLPPRNRKPMLLPQFPQAIPKNPWEAAYRGPYYSLFRIHGMKDLSIQ